MKIDTQFFQGNINYKHLNKNKLLLELPKDTGLNKGQWFAFRISSNRLLNSQFIKIDVRKSFFPIAWENYNAFLSENGNTWNPIQTFYSDEALVLEPVIKETVRITV